MAGWGKIIGGFCGFMLMGPFGLFLGIVVGHVFDRGIYRQQWYAGTGHQTQIQQAFFNATFLVMGYIAKADGRVSEAELQAARAIMSRMGLSEAQRLQAMNLFTQGKQPGFNLEQTLAQLAQACRHNKVLLRLFVELQMQAAQADGGVSQAKQRILQALCQRLGFAPLNFAFFEDLFRFKTGYQQSQGGQQYDNYRAPPRQRFPLRDAYELLGVTESASDTEVKRAYRRLMSQHHPDKLISKGLPEEMLKLATEKTQNIKAAYDCICEARGV